MVARILGTTNFLTGSVPSARIALICSVTFIEPSSDAMPEPTRPATINAASTGPSSRTSETDTSDPVNPIAPKVVSVDAIWRVRTAPVKKPVSMMMVSEPTPTRSIWIRMSLK